MEAKKEAFEAIKPKRRPLKKSIITYLEVIRSANINDLQRAFNRNGKKVGYATITARLAELEGQGLIFKTDRKKENQSIWQKSPANLVQFHTKIVAEKRFKAWLKEGDKYSQFIDVEMLNAITKAVD
jgi:DNA-binding PadR family transcriptional regulator